MDRLDAALMARIAAAVSSPWSSMDALQSDVGAYVARLRSGGASLERALVELRGACRPSIQPGLIGPDSAWVHVVLARIVCRAMRAYCGTARSAEHARLRIGVHTDAGRDPVYSRLWPPPAFGRH